jgi:hypothetical protein
VLVLALADAFAFRHVRGLGGGSVGAHLLHWWYCGAHPLMACSVSESARSAAAAAAGDSGAAAERAAAAWSAAESGAPPLTRAGEPGALPSDRGSARPLCPRLGWC